MTEDMRMYLPGIGVVIGFGVSLLLTGVPSQAFDKDKLREQLTFPLLYFSFSIELPDREWIEPKPTDPKAELKSLRRRLSNTPADAPLRLEMACMYERIGRYGASRLALRQAIRLYQQLIERQPQDPGHLLGYARALRTAKEYQKAIAALEKLIRRGPDSWEAHTELGHTYSDMCEASLEYVAAKYMGLQRFFPPDFKPLSLAEIREAAAKARECYNKAVDSTPHRPEPLYFRAVNTLQDPFTIGEVEDDTEAWMPFMTNYTAIIDLEKAAAISAGSPRGRAFLSALVPVAISRAKARLGWTEKSRLWEKMTVEERSSLAEYEGKLEKVADSSGPEAWRVHEALGLIANIRGDKEDGLLHFGKAFELNPAAAMAYGALLVDCKKKGRLADAVPLIERRISAWGLADDRLYLSRVHAELGRLDLAEEQCRVAVKINPRDAEAHFMMGVLLLKRYGSVERAVDHLQKALIFVLDFGCDNGKDECRFALGIGYLLLGDQERAIETLERTSLPQARKLLEELKGEQGQSVPDSPSLTPSMGMRVG